MTDYTSEVATQGTIIAHELIIRSLLTDYCSRYDRPHASSHQIKAEFLSSLLHVDRQIGQYEDVVWEAASDAMRSTFDHVIQRISHFQKVGLIPPDKE
jgi:hypothetical protein